MRGLIWLGTLGRDDPDGSPRQRGQPQRLGDAGVDRREQAGRGDPVGVGQRPSRRCCRRTVPTIARAAGSSTLKMRSRPLDDLDVRAAHAPQVEQGGGDADRRDLVVVVDRPAQGRDERLLLLGAALEGGDLRRADEAVGQPARLDAGPAHEAGHRVRALAGGVEPRLAVLADGLEHAVASRAVVVLVERQQRLLDQRGQRASDEVRLGARDGDRRFRRERCGDDRDALQQVPLRGVEQLAAPVDHRPQARVPLGQPAQRVVEQGEPVGQAAEHVLDRHRPQPRRRELERERQVVQPVAELEGAVGVPSDARRVRRARAPPAGPARRRRAASAGGARPRRRARGEPGWWPARRRRPMPRPAGRRRRRPRLRARARSCRGPAARPGPERRCAAGPRGESSRRSGARSTRVAVASPPPMAPARSAAPRSGRAGPPARSTRTPGAGRPRPAGRPRWRAGSCRPRPSRRW